MWYWALSGSLQSPCRAKLRLDLSLEPPHQWGTDTGHIISVVSLRLQPLSDLAQGQQQQIPGEPDLGALGRSLQQALPGCVRCHNTRLRGLRGQNTALWSLCPHPVSLPIIKSRSQSPWMVGGSAMGLTGFLRGSLWPLFFDHSLFLENNGYLTDLKSGHFSSATHVATRK